jgi:hypothetical protein
MPSPWVGHEALLDCDAMGHVKVFIYKVLRGALEKSVYLLRLAPSTVAKDPFYLYFGWFRGQ